MVARRDFDPALHGLRGLSALLVVVSHLGDAHMSLGPIPQRGIGAIGVHLFFAHSAYLLVARLSEDVRRQPAPVAVTLYLVRRAFRIYPLFAAVLLMHVAVGNISGAGAIGHLALMEGRHELWAIPVEFHFYLVIPLVVCLASASPRLALSVVAGLGVGSVVYRLSHPFFYRVDPLALMPHLVTFMFGAAMALAIPSHAYSRRSAGTAIVCLGTLALLAVAANILKETVADTIAIGWLTMALFAPLALFWARCPGPIRQFLRSWPCVFLGEISFSLYLTHNFVIVGFHGASGIASAWIALAMTMPVAWVTYTVIERPGMYAGRVLGRWIEHGESRLAPRVTAGA